LTLERPAIWCRGGRRVGDVTTSGLRTLEFVAPLGTDGRRARFVLGATAELLRTEGDLDEPRSVLALDEDTDAGGVALGYRAGKGLCLGVGFRRAQLDGSASRLSWETDERETVRDDMDAQFDLEVDEWSLGAELRRPRRLLGVQFTGLDAHNLTRARDRELNYVSDWDGDGHAWEAYYRRGPKSGQWFLQAYRHEIDGAGPLAGGRMERGRDHFSSHRSLARAGWQAQRGRWEYAASVEFDNWIMHADGFADTEALPYPIGERRGMDGRLELETVALRGGAGRRICRHCTVHSGISLLHTGVDGTLVTKHRENLFAPLETRAEPSLDGHITMASASVGVGYRSADWEITASYSAFAAEMSRSLRRVINPPRPPPPPGAPKRAGTRVEWSDAIGVQVTRQF
jgi:hypothetical protein